MAVRDDVVFITPSSIAKGKPNVYTTWPDPDQESDKIAQYIFSKHKRVSVLSSQQSWESIVANRFKETFSRLGGKVVSFDEPLSDATEIKSEVLRVKRAKPDAIFISSYIHFPRYVKEIARLKIKAPLYGIELDHSALSAAGNPEGVTFIGPSPPANDFAVNYEARYGEKPDLPAPSAYDALYLFANAMKAKGESVSAVREYLDNLGGFDGALGEVSNRGGSISVPMSYYHLKDGKILEIAGG